VWGGCDREAVERRVYVVATRTVGVVVEPENGTELY
jgi:hypothetical protein